MNWPVIAQVAGAFATLFAGIYAVFTRPLEARLQRNESLADARAVSLEARLQRIEDKMDRILEKTTDHGERIRALEERRFR